MTEETVIYEVLSAAASGERADPRLVGEWADLRDTTALLPGFESVKPDADIAR
jgi:hypothetical protein